MRWLDVGLWLLTPATIIPKPELCYFKQTELLRLLAQFVPLRLTCVPSYDLLKRKRILKEISGLFFPAPKGNVINNLLTSSVRSLQGKNLGPRSCNDRALARSIRQGRGWRINCK